MYFVINMFIAAICFISLILFAEVFPKIVKFIFGLVGTFTFAYALVKLYDKIASLTGWYKTDYAITPTLYYTFAITAVVVIIIALVVNKKKAK